MDDEAADVAGDRPVAARLWPAVVAVVAVATLPYAAFLAANVGSDPVLSTVAAWWSATVAVGLATVGLARLESIRAARRVAVVVCVVTWAVLHAHVVEAGRESLGAPLDRAVWWGIVTIAAAAAAVVLGSRPAVQTIAFAIAPVLLVVPVVEGGTALLTTRADTVADDAQGSSPITVAGSPFERRPDVWLFVLDGHGDADVVRRRTDYEPGPFLESLVERGFTIVAGARSNYPVTHLSVASTMQMELVAEDGRAPAPPGFTTVLGGDNRVVDAMLANDYSYVHAYPGLWTDSACVGREDVCLGDEVALSETSLALTTRTPLAGWQRFYGDLDSVAVANDPAAVVGTALADVDGDGPVFGFVHLLPPHPPYLRDGACGLTSRSIFGLSQWGDGSEYGESMACLHAQLDVAVDLVLARDPDAIVVLLGDHGPRFDTDLRQAQVLDDPELFPVLHAARLPEGCAGPPPGTTNVNAMRVVLACLTGTPLDLLPDRQVSVEYPPG